ncbi:uncharacterized protein T551_01510 [Pneumocystis jirovecii RU7]|uniref:Uncharacterized protein n=1 Tax=Pneumocystis jirovecii (strain RU7) TaxID=1408657 RepID=A0A0W4ZRI6_PNEJ7|nr:uncharacterized protein T551_01510 [Pneumocystis jirovecii RU7]KTW30958.1 hypothetical protein T551_01510 [Pneumocystis jirovecii RU7]
MQCTVQAPTPRARQCLRAEACSSGPTDTSSSRQSPSAAGLCWCVIEALSEPFFVDAWVKMAVPQYDSLVPECFAAEPREPTASRVEALLRLKVTGPLEQGVLSRAAVLGHGIACSLVRRRHGGRVCCRRRKPGLARWHGDRCRGNTSSRATGVTGTDDRATGGRATGAEQQWQEQSV